MRICYVSDRAGMKSLDGEGVFALSDLAELLQRRLTDVPADVAERVLGSLSDERPVAQSGADVPTGIFVRSIRVQGFRGIGPAARLELDTHPGLTLVVGRNGSGKSSFAEAAELALTGRNLRWDGTRSKTWREGWRNLHDGQAPRIDLELVTEAGDAAALTLTRAWSATDSLADGQWWERRNMQPRKEFDGSDFEGALELYRPFLSYSELGALIDGKPSDLYDAVHRLLGLDELTAAAERLRTRRLDLDKAAKAVRRAQADLAAELEAVDDERAQQVARLLAAGARVDLGAVAGHVSGSGAEVATIAAVRGLLNLAVPERALVVQAAQRVRAATAALGAAATSDAESDARVLGLLTAARAHHAAVGTCSCPVCGRGALDADWVARTDAELARLSHAVRHLETARAESVAAAAAARALVAEVPGGLGQAATVDTTAAAAAWQRWSELPDSLDDNDFPDAFAAAHAALAAELATVHKLAAAELVRLDEVWSPLAQRLSAWLHDAALVQEAAAELKATKKAEDWLKEQTAAIRDERMAPLGKRAQLIWNELRQQSNVDLGVIQLAGSSTSRHLRLAVTVDDVPGAALGVMSQGELHALGLSLFIPRAALDGSPFRFMIIDDPVQAMDPAKVDGLARVLAKVATVRQVIVFTHDERLPEAVRRLQIDATVLEVQRRAQSAVTVRVAEDPIKRYLADAWALAKTKEVPPDIARDLVATCCRSALEAASQLKVRRTLSAKGFGRAQIDAQLAEARLTHDMVSLAMFGEVRKHADLYKRLNREGAWAAETLRSCKAGAHGAGVGELPVLVADTRRLVEIVLR